MLGSRNVKLSHGNHDNPPIADKEDNDAMDEVDFMRDAASSSVQVRTRVYVSTC